MGKINIEYGITELVEDVYKFNYDAVHANHGQIKLQFQLEHNISIFPDTEKITVSMRVHLLSGAEEIVLQGVRASFMTKPFNNFVNKIDDGGFNVSTPELIDTFISVCIGAARGMLAKNLKGTELDGFVIPLIPMNVIRENSFMK